MILAEDLAIIDWNSYKKEAIREGREEGREEGRKEGIREGREELSELNKWLFAQNRVDDVKRAAEDSDYLNTLFEEYRNRTE